LETGNDKIGNKDRMEKSNEANISFFEKTKNKEISRKLQPEKEPITCERDFRNLKQIL
jgi:hypothetical protein